MGKKFGLQPKVEVKEKAQVEQYDYCFNLVTRNEKTQIAVGNKIVSPLEFNSVEDAKKYIDSKPWQLLIVTCQVCGEIIKQFNK